MQASETSGQPRYYLGLATTFHDPAMALVGPDGAVLFAEATERYLQYKRAPNCEPDPAPRMAGFLAEHLPPDAELVIATTWDGAFSGYLASSAAAGAFDLTRIAALSPEINRSLVPERAERAFIASLHAAQGRAGLGTLLGLDRAFGGRAALADLRRYPHHLTHAALGLWGSPFARATCLVVDGMGETGASALYRLRDGRIEEVRRHAGRESIGFFFGFVTDLAGFDQTKGEEWKVMGLAPYGRRDPDLLALLDRLWRVERGRLRFAGAETARAVAAELLARRPSDAPEMGWADLARCGQDMFCAMVDVLVAEAFALAPDENLVLTGGCALNSSYNGGVLARSGFARLHVPSAPADDGNALGAAWLAYSEDHPGWAGPGGLLSPYLGTPVDARPLARIAPHEPRLRHLGHDGVVEATADLLASGALVGWMQGRAEFGPRALGNRSILADPRPADAKAVINGKVKYREAFRPFAPAILAEAGPAWFLDYQDSPHMERTLAFRPEVRDRVPAVVHADGTGRLQSVTAEGNPRFRALIEAFAARTGVPILLNTSLNVMGKPIVHTVEDALTLFHTTGLDALAVEDWLITKDPPRP